MSVKIFQNWMNKKLFSSRIWRTLSMMIKLAGEKGFNLLVYAKYGRIMNTWLSSTYNPKGIYC